MISERAKKLMESVKYPLAKSSRDLGDEEILKLCSNENPLGPSPKAVETLMREAEKVEKYPDSGSPELKEAIGKYLEIESDTVCIGNGSDELIRLACTAFINPGNKCLIPIPTFSMYEIACRFNIGKPKFVELADFQWRLDELLEAMNDVALAFICRPNNPTGNSIDEDDLRELLKTGRTVIVDEAYADFSGSSVVSWTKSFENLLVLKTFSKIFGLAGLRIGYSVGNPKIIKVLERISSPFNVNRLAQAAAIAAISDEKFVQESKDVVTEGKEYLRMELEDLDLLLLPSDANFLMASLKNWGADAQEVCDYLARMSILIRDLSNFRGAGPEWVRITVGKPDQNERLVEALKSFRGIK